MLSGSRLARRLHDSMRWIWGIHTVRGVPPRAQSPCLLMDFCPHSSSDRCASRLERDLDPRDFVHGVIEGAFALLFPDPELRRRLRLKAISPAANGGLAWYLWLGGRPGAYELAWVSDAFGATGAGVLLALRYFPHPDELVFRRFALVERRARRSGVFDGTGTPAFGRATDLDPRLFHVAAVALEPQGEDHLAVRACVEERAIEERSVGNVWRRVRDVPAAELALPVVDAVIGGIVYLGRAGPVELRAWRQHGTRNRVAATGASWVAPDPTHSAWEFEWSGLVRPGRAAGCAAAAAAPAPGVAPWFAYAGTQPPHEPPWPVSPLWWDAATWRTEPVGAFCGHCSVDNDTIAPSGVHGCGTHQTEPDAPARERAPDWAAPRYTDEHQAS